ncbi:hypothetical protein [Nocardia carnea]|uniref:hypothetical protein n=1 Tax=Nocardia carnea TaxID=37328 RepID=UPI002454FF86|nr:hypothetical protein [Nocardia carnea]
MTSTDNTRPSTELIQRHWPADGPRSPEQALEAASAITQLWRYLLGAVDGRILLNDPAFGDDLLVNLASSTTQAVVVLDSLVADLAEITKHEARTGAMRSLDSAAYAYRVAAEDLAHAANWVTAVRKSLA